MRWRARRVADGATEARGGRTPAATPPAAHAVRAEQLRDLEEVGGARKERPPRCHGGHGTWAAAAAVDQPTPIERALRPAQARAARASRWPCRGAAPALR